MRWRWNLLVIVAVFLLFAAGTCVGRRADRAETIGGTR